MAQDSNRLTELAVRAVAGKKDVVWPRARVLNAGSSILSSPTSCSNSSTSVFDVCEARLSWHGIVEAIVMISSRQ
jgi:hypothetical protein